MKCSRARGLFSVWRDDRLCEKDRERLLAHLASCPSCEENWAQYNEALDPLRGQAVAVPDEFRSAWRRRLAQQPMAGARQPERRPRLTFAWAAAACLTIVAVVGLSQIRGSGMLQPAGEPETFAYDSHDSVAQAPATLFKAAESVPQLRSAPAAPVASQAKEPGLGRKIMQSASLVLESRDVQRTCDAISAAAGQIGGFVRSVSVEGSSGGQRRGTVDISVPAARFDDAIDRVSSMGELIRKEVTGQDVTEEYVDLQARLGNWRNQESQLNVIMSKARNVSEILAVQNELGRVREEIERLTGRMQFLERKTEYADISVTVLHPESAEAVSPVLDVLGRVGGRLLQSALALIMLLVAVLPWAGLGVLALVMVRRWWAKRG